MTFSQIVLSFYPLPTSAEGSLSRSVIVIMSVVADRADGGERAGIDSRSIRAPIRVGEL